jgi:hypothetical protein
MIRTSNALPGTGLLLYRLFQASVDFLMVAVSSSGLGTTRKH